MNYYMFRRFILVFIYGIIALFLLSMILGNP